MQVKERLRAIITGGGTGGHIYPALAIAQGLKKRYPGIELLYIGTKEGMEAEIVPRSGIDFDTVTVAGLERRLTLKNVKTFFKLIRGFAEAHRILNSFKPNVVVGTGGYVCGPVVLAASMRKIPTVIHEQNAFPGLTNRILSKFVDRVCVTFEESVPFFNKNAKIVVTGLPVRPEILEARRSEAVKFFELDLLKPILLVVGGSRGARSINRAVLPVVKWIADDDSKQLVLVTGRTCFREILNELSVLRVDLSRRNNIRIFPFLHRMEYGLAAADLVISRAGASFLAELTVRGVPAVLVPYPFASGNHQEYNARALERKGAARVILDKQLKGDILLNEVKELIDSDILKEMSENSRRAGKPEALDKIIGVISDVTAK